MTNAQCYLALAVELVGLLVIVMMLLMRFRRLDDSIHRLESRIDRLQDRFHNDYEALIVQAVELEAHVSRLEERLEQLT
jgi:hypothetical protein